MNTYVSFADLLTYTVVLTSVINLCYVVFSNKNNRRK